MTSYELEKLVQKVTDSIDRLGSSIEGVGNAIVFSTLLTIAFLRYWGAI